MIKTLLAIGLTALCGFTGLKMDNQIELDLNGNDVRDYVLNHEVSFVNVGNYLNDEQVSEGRYTLEYATSYDELTDTWTYETSINKIGILLAPKNNIYKNEVKLIYPMQIITEQIDSDGYYYNTYVLPNGTEVNYFDKDYEMFGLIIETNQFRYLYGKDSNKYIRLIYRSQSPQVPPDIYYVTEGINFWNSKYQIKESEIIGAFAPYRMYGSINGFSETQNALSDSGTEPKYQFAILTSPFLINGMFFNTLRVYGTSESKDGKYLNTYDHLEANNYVNNLGKITVNKAESGNTGRNIWTYPNGNKYLLFMSDYITTINGSQITQAGSIRAHSNQNQSIDITNDGGSLTNVFDLIAQAFGGFGNYLNVQIFGGLTIGIIITIPLLVGLILWLINLFKRH